MIKRAVRLYYVLYYKFGLDRRIKISNSAFVHNSATFVLGEYSAAGIFISEDVYIGRYANLHTDSRIVIGPHSVISDYVYISTLSHGLNPENGPIMDQKSYDKGMVCLGRNVFLGFGVKVLPNVTLGDWTIVGAGAVVTKSFPGYCMLAGNPAKMIKVYVDGQWKRMEEEVDD